MEIGALAQLRSQQLRVELTTLEAHLCFAEIEVDEGQITEEIQGLRKKIWFIKGLIEHHFDEQALNKVLNNFERTSK